MIGHQSTEAIKFQIHTNQELFVRDRIHSHIIIVIKFNSKMCKCIE